VPYLKKQLPVCRNVYASWHTSFRVQCVTTSSRDDLQDYLLQCLCASVWELPGMPGAMKNVQSGDLLVIPAATFNTMIDPKAIIK